jgi:hypothetical protein
MCHSTGSTGLGSFVDHIVTNSRMNFTNIYSQKNGGNNIKVSFHVTFEVVAFAVMIVW